MRNGTIPLDLVVHRLLRHMNERDQLVELLAHVEAGHMLTNRLHEAVILVPEDILDKIRQVVVSGAAPTTQPMETPDGPRADF